MISESSNILIKRRSKELHKMKGVYKLEVGGENKSPNRMDCFMQDHLPVEGAYGQITI